MSKRKRHIIVVLATIALLVTAGTAYGYGETWGGWFTSGTIYYNNNPYTWSGSGGSVKDTTGGTTDLFYITSAVPTLPFTYGTDTIFLAVNSFNGSKPTGQTGTKGGGGNWGGSYYIKSSAQSGNISGTWLASFDYSNNPPTYRGGWTVTSATPPIQRGDGSSVGQRVAFW